MPEQLGAHNPRIARARELLAKKGRDAHGRFLIEGPTMLAEALAHGAPVESVFATAQAYEDFGPLKHLDPQTTPVYVVASQVLAKLSDVEAPPGMVAVCRAQTVAPAAIFEHAGTVLVLAGVSDPGNAGTLVRSADAFGASRVVFGAGSVEAHNPKVIRASMGSIFHVAVCEAGPDAVAAAAAGWEFIGLDGGGGPLDGLAGGPKRAIVVGQERRGLGPWAALCSRTVSIPTPGSAESLNAAVAGSIALFEATRGGG